MEGNYKSNGQDLQRSSLRYIVFNYPAIDNHAHPLLKEEYRQSLAFEGSISEARPDTIGEAVYSLPGYRATRQLAELYGLDPDVGWEEIKRYRDSLAYDQLCNMNMKRSGIQCLLLDDGLRGAQEMANDLSWHGRFTNNSVYRLVRIEAVAEVRIRHPRIHRCCYGIDSVTGGSPEIPLPNGPKHTRSFPLSSLHDAARFCTRPDRRRFQIRGLLSNRPQCLSQPQQPVRSREGYCRHGFFAERGRCTALGKQAAKRLCGLYCPIHIRRI
jgi:hypothetical protein